MHVKVTDKHIREGEQGSARHCPIALAIADALPGTLPPYIAVFGRAAIVGNSSYLLPPEAYDFVVAYDGYEYVGPLEFDLLANTSENAGRVL
jgi:hypothetical protein